MLQQENKVSKRMKPDANEFVGVFLIFDIFLAKADWRRIITFTMETYLEIGADEEDDDDEDEKSKNS